MVSTLFLPLAVLHAGDQLFLFDAVGISTMDFPGANTIGFQPELIYPTWALFALVVVISLIACVTIFLFKKRILQIRLCVFNAILMLGFYILFGFFWWNLPLGVASTNLKIALSFPLICLILDYLAIRNIGADETLVRSLERLR